MTAVMSAVRANPQEAVTTILDTYMMRNTMIRQPWQWLKEMGRAGNPTKLNGSINAGIKW